MENDNPRKMKVQIVSVIELFVFLFDIYVIVNMTKNYQILGIAGCLTLVWSIVTINTWLKWKEKDKQRSEEQYVDIMKAEKSTHLVSQKRFQDLDEKLNFIGQKIMPLEKSAAVNQKKIANMLEDLMDGQKKVAKITISRSKENANALMNSNDQLIKQMGEFQQSILEMKEEVLEKQDQIYEQKIHKMDENQKELFEKIQEASSILKNVIDEIPENISKISPPVINNVVVGEKMEPESIESVSEPMAESIPESVPEEMTPESIPEPALEAAISKPVSEDPNKTMSPEDIAALLENAEEMVSESASEPMAELEPIEEPEVISEPELAVIPEPISEDTNKTMSPEDIAALLASTEEMMPEEPEPEVIIEPEAIVVSEPEAIVVPEPIPEPEPIVEPETLSEPEPIVIPEVIPEPVAIPEPKAEDPNKMMSPEDIAALIANTTAEELPETADKIVEEEKPPMPDVSDPGKMMSPEDIAALIANM